MTVPAALRTERMLLLAAPDQAGLLAALDAGSPSTSYRGPGPRLGLLDPTPERLATARRLVAKGRPVRRRSDLWFRPEPLLARDGGLAFIFPGLEGEFAPRIDDVAEHLGVPAPEVTTGTLVQHGAAVLAVGRLLDVAVRRLGIRPTAVAGHSVGEWAAMISGGIVSGAEFDAMIERSDLDAMRVPGVEFAVLGCSADRVRPELARFPGVVISHENSANQTVVCGPEHAVAGVIALLRSRSVICQALPFRSGFHTPMLEPYLGYFRDGVPSLRMRPAAVPVWSATTAAPFPDDPAGARELCLRHLVEPVRFRQLVRALHDSGVRAFVLLGPGQLGSLIEDTLRHDVPDADFLVIPANSAQRAGLDQLRRCAVALWTEGAEPDFTALDPTAEDPPAPAPDATGGDGFAQLAALSATMPLAAEMAGFLAHTAEAVATVLRAAHPERQPGGWQAGGAGGVGKQSHFQDRSRPESGFADTSGAGHREVLDVSLEAMPYLRDHCLMRQRPGWPEEEDLRPVVPATTMVTHMIEAAERAGPGLVAVAVEDVRFHRWLLAVPPRSVPIEIEHRGAGHAHVRLGEHAEGTVLLGARRTPAPEGAWAPARASGSPS